MIASGFEEAARRATEAVGGAKRILVTSHRRPDGDGLGCMSALGSLLAGPGRSVVLYNPDAASRRYAWMPNLGAMRRRLHDNERFDVTIVVDCADPDLMVGVLPAPERCGTVVMIDHHARGKLFGDIVLHDGMAAAVSVLIVRWASLAGMSLTKDIASALYVSLVSDTGWFRHANTNAEALRIGAVLIDAGAVPQDVSASLEERPSLQRSKLTGLALSHLEVVCDGRVGMICISQAEVEAAGCSWEDIDGLVNLARGIDGTVVGVMLASGQGPVRVSMRSRNLDIDVGAICHALGGGGHAGAAGCAIDRDMAEAKAMVIAALDRGLASAPLV